MKPSRLPTRSAFGFSIHEMLLVVAVIGIFAAVSIPLIQNITTSSKGVKLENDLAVLNSAVKSYLLFGGKLEGDESLEVVLAKLKSRATDETADQVVGLRGSFLDPRYEPVMQTEEESASGSPRAYWDSSLGKFVSATTGPVGIKKFRLNEEYTAPETELTESRETALSYAHNSTWIWDYEDAAAPSHVQATPVNVALVPGDTGSVPAPGTPPSLPPSPPPAPTLPPPSATPTVLLPPIFSIPPGTFPIKKYDLSVAITDPNPIGSSIYFSIDFGSWIKYTGTAVTISPNKVLKAQAVPLDLSTGAFLFSTVKEGTYSASYDRLLPPTFTLSGGAYNSPITDTVNAVLNNPNDVSISRVDYRLNGGPWVAYTGKFQLKSDAYPSGVTLEAYSVSTTLNFLDSIVASRLINIPVLPPDVDFDVTVLTAP